MRFSFLAYSQVPASPPCSIRVFDRMTANGVIAEPRPLTSERQLQADFVEKLPWAPEEVLNIEQCSKRLHNWHRSDSMEEIGSARLWDAA